VAEVAETPEAKTAVDKCAPVETADRHAAAREHAREAAPEATEATAAEPAETTVEAAEAAAMETTVGAAAMETTPKQPRKAAAGSLATKAVLSTAAASKTPARFIVVSSS
jgi:hypothetical protein